MRLMVSPDDVCCRHPIELVFFRYGSNHSGSSGHCRHALTIALWSRWLHAQPLAGAAKAVVVGVGGRDPLPNRLPKE